MGIITENITEIIAALRDKNRSEAVVILLKNTTEASEEILGLKLFLEQNDYDLNKLDRYLNQAEIDFKSLKSESLNVNKTKLKVVRGGSNIRKNIVRVVASVSLLIAVSLGYSYFKTPNYLDKYAISEPGMPVFMSAIGKKEMDDWMTEYKAENYQKAQQMGEVLLRKSNDNDTVNFYQGVILVHLKEYDESIVLFQKVSVGNPILREKSQFWEAISYLYIDKNEAKLKLEEIQQSGNSFAKKAEVILHSEF